MAPKKSKKSNDDDAPFTSRARIPGEEPILTRSRVGRSDDQVVDLDLNLEPQPPAIEVSGGNVVRKIISNWGPSAFCGSKRDDSLNPRPVEFTQGGSSQFKEDIMGRRQGKRGIVIEEEEERGGETVIGRTEGKMVEREGETVIGRSEGKTVVVDGKERESQSVIGKELMPFDPKKGGREDTAVYSLMNLGPNRVKVVKMDIKTLGTLPSAVLLDAVLAEVNLIKAAVADITVAWGNKVAAGVDTNIHDLQSLITPLNEQERLLLDKVSEVVYSLVDAPKLIIPSVAVFNSVKNLIPKSTLLLTAMWSPHLDQMCVEAASEGFELHAYRYADN